MPADNLEARVRARLSGLRTSNLLRTMRPPFGVDLSSNDYLRLSAHPCVGGVRGRNRVGGVRQHRFEAAAR